METNENVILEEKRAGIAVKTLKLEKVQLENEIRALENSRNTLKEQTQSINEELGKVTNDLNNAKTELKVVLESSTVARMDKETFEKDVESFREEMPGLDEDLDGSYQVTEQDSKDGKDGEKGGHGVTVHAFGGTFDEKNRPSSKNVSPEDEVSTKSWGSVNKTLVRKLAFLAGEKAHAYFGLVEGTRNIQAN